MPGKTALSIGMGQRSRPGPVGGLRKADFLEIVHLGKDRQTHTTYKANLNGFSSLETRGTVIDVLRSWQPQKRSLGV